MPYAIRTCPDCNRPFQPHTSRPNCWACESEKRYGPGIPPPARECEVDRVKFIPPKNDPETKRCPSCRRMAERPRPENPYQDFRDGASNEIPKADEHHLAPPLTQAVFDLETFSLDRGWGVTMVGSILVHGQGGPKMHTFDLRQSSTWPHRRSHDAELGAKILGILYDCDVLYAHNGMRFDVPWLNSVALRYNMPSLVGKKLVDPCQVARQKYRIGRNSLGNLADFLGLEEQKMPVSIEVWKAAIFDADDSAWETLRARCESDVRVLNALASKVTRDVGMIDARGSAR